MLLIAYRLLMDLIDNNRHYNELIVNLVRICFTYINLQSVYNIMSNLIVLNE